VVVRYVRARFVRGAELRPNTVALTVDAARTVAATILRSSIDEVREVACFAGNQVFLDSGLVFSLRSMHGEFESGAPWWPIQCEALALMLAALERC
jgi:small-conductance mechanosensitive channel